MPEVELEAELYEKIEDWILANSIDMTVDEFVNELIQMVFEDEAGWLSNF